MSPRHATEVRLPLAGRSARELTCTPVATVQEDDRIEAFTIDIPEDVLVDLRERLARARLPDEPEGVGWQLGMSQAYLTQLIEYWQDEFDWRAQERRLNEFEQFKTRIDGLDVHFVHRRSPEPDAFPLILPHGWPGTFAEFFKVIGPLTDPAACSALDALDRRMVQVTPLGIQGEGWRLGEKTHRVLDRRPGADKPSPSGGAASVPSPLVNEVGPVFTRIRTGNRLRGVSTETAARPRPLRLTRARIGDTLHGRQ